MKLEDKIKIFRKAVQLKGIDARTDLKKAGFLISPVGNRNMKTFAFGTYRKVVDTCPLDCAQMTNCYATRGSVGIHQQRASQGLEADLNAVLVTALAAEQSGTPIRLHVSGDFYKEDKIDKEYVDGIFDIFENVKATVWTYTHRDDEYLDKIKNKIHIRYSEQDGPMGAIVVKDLKNYKLKKGQFKCPNDLDKSIKCANCKLCWTVKSTVVFQEKKTGRPKNG